MPLRTKAHISPCVAGMCFSAEADVVAGVVIGVIGVDALRHVRRPAERALAAVPVVLAAHLLIEAFVWWGLDGQLSRRVVLPASWAYLAIAFGVLPILVPLAVAALEPASSRRRIRPFLVVGIAVSAVLMYSVVRGPVEASIRGNHIDYRVDLWLGGALVALYLIATCGSLLTSTHAHVRWFGTANLFAALGLTWLDKASFISLWCFWATVTSVAIAVHLRFAGRPPSRLVPA